MNIPERHPTLRLDSQPSGIAPRTSVASSPDSLTRRVLLAGLLAGCASTKLGDGLPTASDRSPQAPAPQSRDDLGSKNELILGRMCLKAPGRAALAFSAATIGEVEYIEHAITPTSSFTDVWAKLLAKCEDPCSVDELDEGFKFYQQGGTIVALQAVGHTALLMRAPRGISLERLRQLGGTYLDHVPERRSPLDFGLGRGMLGVAPQQHAPEEFAAELRLPGKWELSFETSSYLELEDWDMHDLRSGLQDGLSLPIDARPWQGDGLSGVEIVMPPQGDKLDEGLLMLNCFGRKQDPLRYPDVYISLFGQDWTAMLRDWPVIKTSLRSLAESAS